jgi:hypothetical protein
VPGVFGGRVRSETGAVMKVVAIKFFCDTPKCHNSFVTTETSDAGSYLDLAEAGWLIKRHIISGWKHHCPEHRSETKP